MRRSGRGSAISETSGGEAGAAATAAIAPPRGRGSELLLLAAEGAATGAGAGASSTSVSSPESESLVTTHAAAQSAGICWKVADLVAPFTVSPSRMIGGSPGPIVVSVRPGS